MEEKSVTFPQDLIENILSRLPVRSLLRFKCVCKSWLSLISDPQFAKLHFDLAASPTHRLLHKLPRQRSIQSRDIQVPFDQDSSLVNLFLPPPPSHEGYLEILGCQRGLVLLIYHTRDLVLWNPSTGLRKRISHSPPDAIRCPPHCAGFHGFGYDAATDDYFVVFMRLYFLIESSCPVRSTEVEFFSLKTNSWNCVKFQGLYDEIKQEFKAGVLVNGAIHWLVLPVHSHLPAIVAFDWTEQSFYEIPPPPTDYLTLDEFAAFPKPRVMGGYLAVCYPGYRMEVDVIEIWVMKEYRVRSSWTKTLVVSASLNFVPGAFSPMCYTKGGGIFGTFGPGWLVKFDDKGELIEELRYPVAMELEARNLHNAIYRESLLPPPSE
ncbi:hypothetical protein RJT34_18453 [Clitoria ternatea]|uniref:F-box domain-containing protein n=1 Tax=Clitoria ternatea TaxID=43366 RepID=A0AAN9JD19_CLITE